MAFYDTNKYKNHKAYVSQEPAYGSPTNYPDHIQRPTMMFRNSESYVIAKTEQVVKFERGDHDSPTRKELYKDHGAGAEKDRGPRPNNFGKDKTPPPTYCNTPDYGKYTHLSSDDDSAPKNRYAPPPPPPPGYPVPYHDNGYAPLKLEPRPQINTKIYEREKNKTSGNAPLPGYPVPYHDKTSYNDNNNERKHGKGDNGGYVPPKLKLIPQIKTRIGDPEFAKASPPKRGTQGYQKVIDSTEAGGRYGGPCAEEMSNETIDCKEAAKKYNGVFVP